jgi:hypothetical protein
VKTDVDQRFRKEETKEREKSKEEEEKKREDVVLCHREKEKKI